MCAMGTGMLLTSIAACAEDSGATDAGITPRIAQADLPVDHRAVPPGDSVTASAGDLVEASVADSAEVDRLAARAAGSAAATVATVIDLARRGGRAARSSPSWRDGRSRRTRRRRHPGPPAGSRRRGPDAGFPRCIFASRIRL